ncbi:MAG: hypothetical protein Q9O74_09430 [Planctomycetota bacterium]|nr:hypothetical protein [Planctomycetota bacterium]
MSIVPRSRLGKVEFYEIRISPWATNAAAIGLDVGDVTALGTATGAARVAYNEMIAARTASKAATQNFYDMVSTMHSSPGFGSDMIDTIKNFAQTTNDPNVYTLAQIPGPTPPGVVGPPGTPFDFRVALLQDGSVELKWKSSNPAGATGTVYEIFRSIDGAAMTYVDTVGEKVFTDTTLPNGCGPVTYRVTGVRSTVKGDPGQFTVQMGTGTVTEEGEGEPTLGIAA